MTGATAVVLRVVVEHAPSGPATEFGLQDTAGGIADGVTDGQGRVAFECDVRVAPASPTGKPNFLGPFTHGSPASRHLYLSQRTSGADGWVKRIKLPLGSITWEMVGAAAGGFLETTVDGRASATVPVEWRIGQAMA